MIEDVIDKIVTKEDVENLILLQGFDVVRTLNINDIPNISDNLYSWLEAGFHGDMKWMLNNFNRRSHNDKNNFDYGSIFIVGMNYNDKNINPLDRLKDKNKGAISIYADNKDYHDIMKKSLKKSARILQEKYNINSRLCVDTAPVHEKSLAQKSGIGWQGKHTNIVSRELGSWLFLGGLFIQKDFKSDKSEIDHCGSCNKCITACPTDAFVNPYMMDSRRCISYLTIEYKGVFPQDLYKKMKNYIYGCDICLAVCPWNKFAKMANNMDFHHRVELHNPPLEELIQLDDTSFRILFRKSPIKRIGRDRFIRNVINAMGNSGNKDFIPYINDMILDSCDVIRITAKRALKDLSCLN